MKEVLKKIAAAKKAIANTSTKKEGWNDYSKYNYFTPDQIKQLSHEQEEKQGLLLKFDFERDQFGAFGLLTVFDTETGQSIQYKAATEIPQITATNAAQQHGGAMTFVERYLLQFAFGISDNSLDPDATHNTEARMKQKPAAPAEDDNKPWLNLYSKDGIPTPEYNKLQQAITDGNKYTLFDIRGKYKVSKEAATILKDEFNIS